MQLAALVIDRDFGFLFWICRLLDDIGYEAFPAKTASDAIKLVQELQITVSLLIFDCLEPEAELLLRKLEGAQPIVQTICLDGVGHAACIPGIRAICPKPQSSLEEAGAAWLHTLKHLLPFKSAEA